MFLGGYNYGGSASLNPEGDVNLITLRRNVEIVSDPNASSYKVYLVRVGDTVFSLINSLGVGEWGEIKVVGEERVSEPVSTQINSRTPQAGRPFDKVETACVDKYGNIHVDY